MAGKNSPLHEGCIALVVPSPEMLGPLISIGLTLRSHSSRELALVITLDDGQVPAWFTLPDSLRHENIQPYFIDPQNIGRSFKRSVGKRPVSIVVSGIGVQDDGQDNRNVQMIGTLSHVLRRPTYMFVVPQDWDFSSAANRVLIPNIDNNDTEFAIGAALRASPDAEITVMHVASDVVNDNDLIAQKREFEELLEAWSPEKKCTSRFLVGDSIIDALLKESEGHDAIILSTGDGHAMGKVMFGDSSGVDAARDLVKKINIPVVAVRKDQGLATAWLRRLFTRGESLVPSLTKGERIDVYRQIRRGARPKIDFFAMICLSAGIAGLGLILNSPAVIIGAMLVAPLMSAIIGMGLAIVHGDLRFLATSAAATLRGSGLAIVVGLVIGIFYLDTRPTPEMLARTAPTLLDLLVALISGVAAAYALSRKDVAASLPGVAIAVALVPPLATAGIFLGMLDLAHAGGAFFLFLTNLVTITFASCVVFAMLGFRPPQEERVAQQRLRSFHRSFVVASIFVILVVGWLTVLTVREIREAKVERVVENTALELLQGFSGAPELVSWKVSNAHDKTLDVEVIVSTFDPVEPAKSGGYADILAERLGKPVKVRITQLKAVASTSTGYFNSKRDSKEQN